MYKKIIFTLSFPLISLALNAQDVSRFSLQQANEYALEHNQSILNAQLDIEVAEGVVKENIATGLPQINANVDLAYNFSLPVSFLPSEFIPGAPPGEQVAIEFGTKYSGNASIGANQMIFDGVFFVGLEAAKTYRELSTKNHIKSKIDVVEAVSKAYYSVLVNRLTLELVEKNYGRLDSLLQETKAMYTSGFAEKIDVNRVQVQFNNIKINQENTKKMLAISENLLKFQMGMPINQGINLTDELGLEMFDDSEEVSEGYENRVEYSILKTQERLALLDIKRTKVEYLPRLDLYASLGAIAGTGAGASLFNIGNEWFEFGLAGVKMSVPIFDGLRKQKVLQQKKTKLAQVHNNFDFLENSINLEIDQKYIEYDNSIKFMNVQLENMKLSKEVYDVTKEKYQEGVGSNLEVINADADYKEAQTNFFMALYNTLIAKVDYKKSIGKLL
jgi:outer membrane protein